MRRASLCILPLNFGFTGPPEYWDYRCEPPRLVIITVFVCFVFGGQRSTCCVLPCELYPSVFAISFPIGLLLAEWAGLAEQRAAGMLLVAMLPPTMVPVLRSHSHLPMPVLFFSNMDSGH